MKSLFFKVAFLLAPYLLFAATPEHGSEHEKEHHNHYELEVSVNDQQHTEYTGSVYFMPKRKVQVTADQSLEHFASVLVQEIPFRNSHWGTFAGFGGAYGIHHHLDHETHHQLDEEMWALIVQSGLAYSIDSHWSTGFTVSPGWDISKHAVVTDATFDLVYGF